MQIKQLKMNLWYTNDNKLLSVGERGANIHE